MKSFIKLSIWFSVLLFLTLSILVASTEFLVNKNSVFKLKINSKYIVLGHSHPECAFNDSLINNFENVSQSGESYFYTYFKTKKILQQNPTIEAVFIEFGNNQISESMNNWIWSEKYMNDRYPRYSSFMDASDKFLLAKNNFIGYMNALSLSSKENLGRIINNNFDYSNQFGGYLYLVRDKTDSLVKNMTFNDPKLRNHNISEDNLTYLNRTIEYCEKMGKKVILIRSPQHEKYTGYFNEIKYKEILNTRYSKIEYLDFSKFPLTNSEFGDFGHLNYKGAKVFSLWFESMLSDGILEKIEKQKYINKKMRIRMGKDVMSSQ